MILPDLLKKDLDIVFCGTAVGNTSAEKESYYAGSGNLFYPILFKTGFTPTLITPSNYSELLKYNIGLTDIAKWVSGNDDELENDDFDVESFISKIQKYEPKVVCFNGKAASAVFLYNDKKKTKLVKYGWLKKTIIKTRMFVAPSTSGQGRIHWDEDYWFKVKNELNND